MCGILLNIGNETITPDHPALEIIAHRGPDGFGAENFDCDNFKVGLGHRRLSIIDLSESGHQPMSYDNGRFWIIYNGEIYNYREIRKELESEKFQFKSSCDTEVLLAAYKKWGRNCLSKFNGMFAFAIYDTLEKKVFLARDRFGIKPLYYLNTPKCFRAASELKQFISVEGFSPRINKIKLYHFLNSGDFDYDNETLWKDILEIPPGHFAVLDLVKWDPGLKFETEEWYSPPFFEDKFEISYEDAVREFRRILQDSVRLRLRADVPVGFLLSGGIDSSSLVGLAHLMPGERNENLKTYSSCYADTKRDEREYINEMLKFTGAESCLHFPKPADVTENLEKVIWNNDLPILQGSPSVHWLLYKKIKEENDSRKVIMEGQGGDEIMCGYGDFYWAMLNENMHKCLFSFVGQLKTFQSYHHEPWKIVIRKLLRVNFPSFVKYPPNPLIRPEELLGREKIPPIAVLREEPTVSKLHKDRFTILKYILHNVDRNSMAHSREARVPFLDYRLVEFCLKLPDEYKISGGHSKRIIRDAVKEFLPAKIATRVSKQGYSSPIAMWAKDGLRDFFQENILDFAEMPFVNSRECSESFEKYLQGKSHFDPVIWRMITVKKWIDVFKAQF